MLNINKQPENPNKREEVLARIHSKKRAKSIQVDLFITAIVSVLSSPVSFNTIYSME